MSGFLMGLDDEELPVIREALEFYVERVGPETDDGAVAAGVLEALIEMLGEVGPGDVLLPGGHGPGTAAG